MPGSSERCGSWYHENLVDVVSGAKGRGALQGKVRHTCRHTGGAEKELPKQWVGWFPPGEGRVG